MTRIEELRKELARLEEQEKEAKELIGKCVKFSDNSYAKLFGLHSLPDANRGCGLCYIGISVQRLGNYETDDRRVSICSRSYINIDTDYEIIPETVFDDILRSYIDEILQY